MNNSKKRAVLFLLLILAVNFIFIVSSNDLEQNINDLGNKIENVTDTVDEFKYLNKTEKESYLFGEWKKIILKNSVLSALNNTFIILSPLFFILFSYNYDFSITLIFILILWTFFFISFNRILRDFSGLSRGVSLLVSLLIVIFLSHIKLFLIITNFLFNLIFFQEGFLINFISFLIFIFGLIFLFTLIKGLGKEIRMRRKKLKEEENEFKQKLSEVEREAFSKSIKHIEDSLKD